MRYFSIGCNTLKAVLYYFYEAHQENFTSKKDYGNKRLLSDFYRKYWTRTDTKDEKIRSFYTDSLQLGTE